MRSNTSPTKRIEPIEPVFHGGDLPENLSPREDVPALNGNMLGPGLYTTASPDMAAEYAWGQQKIYGIRNSKTGQVYDTFDLDQEMTQADRDNLMGVSAGWHAHLDMLVGVLRGGELPFLVGLAVGWLATRAWRAARRWCARP